MEMTRQPPRPHLIGFRSSKFYASFTACFAVFTYTTLYGLVTPMIPFMLKMIDEGIFLPDNTQGGLIFYSTHGVTADVPRDVQILAASYLVSCMTASPILGYLGDQAKHRRTPMLIGTLGLLTATFLFLFASNYWMLAFARMLQGASGATIWMLSLILIADTYPERIQGLQTGTMMMFHDTGMQTGGLIGGSLYSKYGYKGPFTYSLLMIATTSILRILLIERRNNPIHWFDVSQDSTPRVSEADSGIESVAHKSQSSTGYRSQSPTTHKSQSSDDVKGSGDDVGAEPRTHRILSKLLHPRLFCSMLQTFTIGFSIASMQLVIPAHLGDEFGFDTTQAAMAFMALCIPSIIASPIAGFLYDKDGPRFLCSAAILVCGLSAILMVLPSGARPNGSAVFIVLLSVFGFSNALAYSPMFPEISRAVKSLVGEKEETKGLSYGLACGSWCLGYLVGPLICSFLYTAIGFRWVCVVIASIMVLISAPLILIFSGYTKKKQPRRPKEPRPPAPEPVAYINIAV
ncbi:major facilitator superfamily domain-containing protein [Fennellomyces sp. T-0311]|nr:major facilitator superfamily domain-containing protein [Fennellomyces sp. T-0311]